MGTSVRFGRLKRLVGHLLCNTWTGRLVGAVTGDRIPYHGCIVDTRGAPIPAKTKAALLVGLYESAEYRFVNAYLRADLDTIELGSGLGALTSHIAQRLTPGLKLVCVEANPGLMAPLKANLSAYGAHLQSVALLAGLSANRPQSDLQPISFRVGPEPLTSSLTSSDNCGKDVVSIPTISLETLWRMYVQGPYQLIADIEGAEAGLIEVEERALRSCRQMIVELHATPFQGRSGASDYMIDKLCQSHEFRLVDRYGPVCVFMR